MEETKAEKYEKHLKRVRDYQTAHPDKCREKCRAYHARVKEDPEKYAALLEKKKLYYKTVRKPKLDAEKSKKKEEESKTE
jgi:hypothetical protein